MNRLVFSLIVLSAVALIPGSSLFAQFNCYLDTSGLNNPLDADSNGIMDGGDLPYNLDDGAIGFVNNDADLEIAECCTFALSPSNMVSSSFFGNPGTITVGYVVEDTGATLTPNVGFAAGASHDNSIFTATAIYWNTALGQPFPGTCDAADCDGSLYDLGGPGQFFPNVMPVDMASNPLSGWKCGVLYDASGLVSKTFDAPRRTLLITFEINPGVEGMLAGNMNGMTSLMQPDDTVIQNSVTVGASSSPATIGGSIEINFVAVFDTAFIRGDANNDGEVDLADGIYIINHEFLAGPGYACREAANANNSTEANPIELGDSVLIFQYLFAFGPPPAPPFMSCGTDPGDVCDSFDGCP